MLIHPSDRSLQKSNCPEILQHLPLLLNERTLLSLDSESAPLKTLGLQWHTTTDKFIFDVLKWNESAVITKRVILSDAVKLFDPLGLVGPVIVQAKICLQDLWRNKKSWDEPLDEDFQIRWKEFRNTLASLRNLAIFRWVIPVVSSITVEMHGFCDDSEKAYAACIYLHIVAVRYYRRKSFCCKIQCCSAWRH